MKQKHNVNIEYLNMVLWQNKPLAVYFMIFPFRNYIVPVESNPYHRNIG